MRKILAIVVVLMFALSMSVMVVSADDDEKKAKKIKLPKEKPEKKIKGEKEEKVKLPKDKPLHLYLPTAGDNILEPVEQYAWSPLKEAEALTNSQQVHYTFLPDRSNKKIKLEPCYEELGDFLCDKKGKGKLLTYNKWNENKGIVGDYLLVISVKKDKKKVKKDKPLPKDSTDSPNVATDGEYNILYFDNGDVGLWDTYIELDDEGEIDDHDGDYDVVLMDILASTTVEELSAELGGGMLIQFPDPRVPAGMAFLYTEDGQSFDLVIMGIFMQMAFVPGIDVEPYSYYLADNYL